MSVEDKRGLPAFFSPEAIKVWGTAILLTLILAIPGLAGCGASNDSSAEATATPTPIPPGRLVNCEDDPSAWPYCVHPPVYDHTQ